ncbi:MAG: hypothetical protein JNL97_03700 [Verrucomicrobiales bacterium]|nr:hypothetical protein [Verrucomicrobiales bacterium]
MHTTIETTKTETEGRVSAAETYETTDIAPAAGPVIPAPFPAAGNGVPERNPVRACKPGQMELGFRTPPTARSPRPERTRRYVAARWWFARMRETVRSTPEWTAESAPHPASEQVLLSLAQPPTRFERRQAA